MKKILTPSLKKTHKKDERPFFDKYLLYHESVQSVETDAQFLEKVFIDLRGKKPKVFREDFCGTFALSCEWVKLRPYHRAVGVDLDPEPMEYGKREYLSQLKEQQKKRLELVEGNVLTSKLPSADLVAAMNFSYFIFKKRSQMKQYFENVFKSLNKNGVFLVDLFGGSQCYDAIEDRTPHKGFTYYWDQTGFDPVSNEALFHIHFKVGKTKVKKVFTYDWRLWSIPELREIMEEVGFKKTHVYWEGTNSKGGGNGIFTRTEKGEPCLSWIAYIVAEK